MTMKENQNPTSYEALTFGSEELFETKVSDENRKGVEDISMDNQNELADLAGCDQENEFSGPLSFHVHGKDENLVTAEEVKAPCNGNECVVSKSSLCHGASDLFETVTNEFTDKNVLECELGVMKDIGVDNGTPEIKEEKDGKSVDQERIITSPIASSEKDTAEHWDLSELDQAATKSPEEDSPVDKDHPVQEADTLILLGSNEGNDLVQPTDQVENAVSVDPVSSSPDVTELEDNVQAGSLLFNRNVRSGSITFDFLNTGQEQPSESSPISNTQCASSEKQHVDANSDDLSSDGQTQSLSSTNDDAPVIDPKWKYDHGETSFSAVTYSDPVALSRSLSHRSDASTTSARSFAFPVLQSEWNSSPVRMAKADRKHFRKQKGWRSGLLCCRF